MSENNKINACADNCYKGKVLIVEDSAEIRDLLYGFLTKNGYDADCASDGRTASEWMREKEYILILMDLMLPYKSGEMLIKELRESGFDVPVICVSAKSEMDTRLEVLRMGADDYILKPFDLNEVLVRMETVLRRTRAQTDKDKRRVLSAGELRFYCDEQRVEYRGGEIILTAKEMQILKLFLEYPSKTYSKANLYETVWEDTYYYEDNTVNVHVSNLRKKLKNATGHDYIDTVWGIGYRLNRDYDNKAEVD